eukprot:CCRYP_007037-RD/>CCRYP_007037-RD protein AED:0.49 eAED:1.00 QI:0/0/0/1/0/0/2/0/83
MSRYLGSSKLAHSNGGNPTSIINKTTPAAQRSTAKPSKGMLFVSTSGEMVTRLARLRLEREIALLLPLSVGLLYAFLAGHEPC